MNLITSIISQNKRQFIWGILPILICLFLLSCASNVKEDTEKVESKVNAENSLTQIEIESIIEYEKPIIESIKAKYPNVQLKYNDQGIIRFVKIAT